jgi:hypothetical protein
MLPCLNDANTYKIDLFMDAGFRRHRASKHLHNFTKAFDPPEERLGFLVEKQARRGFSIEDAEPTDGYIKLTGVWQIDESTVPSFRMGSRGRVEGFDYPLKVSLNGRKIWSGVLHMPIVCAGWPSVYWRIPPGCLQKGYNELRLDIEGKSLLVNQCTVFVRTHPGTVMQPLFSPRVLLAGKEFTVTLMFHEPASGISIKHDDAIEPLSAPSEAAVGEQEFRFKASGPAKASRLIFTSGGRELEVELPPVLDLPEGLPCHVGTDSDDHRHDDTGMMDEILMYLFRSELGDMVMFRPKVNRNCTGQPSAELCRAWIDICRRFNAKYLLCDWRTSCEFPSEVYAEAAKDPNCIGSHAHEPYFMMVDKAAASPELRDAKDFKDAHRAFIASMKEWVDRCHALGIKAAAGEASWLAVYNVEAGFEQINAEAVTGFSPHFGVVRGALRGRPNVTFGHHIAIEWYLGYPYDNLKTHRFRLFAYLTWTHGGQYVYAENSLFFSNSYERHDPEDPFPAENRSVLRRFYDMVRVQPRTGEQCAELAAIYGNLESIFWYDDDVLPEMDSTSRWDQLFWNKWDGSFCKPAWRALDGWLPPLEIEPYNKNRSILKWFASNPYGNVDVISINRPADILSKYKVLAFLGWNTMTDDIVEKLKKYVHNGGILFIGGCHFDRRTLSEGEYAIDTSGAENLLGLSVTGPGALAGDVAWQGGSYSAGEGIRLCSLKLHNAEILAKDKSGNPVLLHNRYGKGEVYFNNFWDYPATKEVVELTKSFLSRIGELAQGDFGLEDAGGINCSHWHDRQTGTRRLYLVNINWQKPRTSQACLIRLWGRPFPVAVRPDAPLVVTVKDGIAVAPESPFIYVENIRVEGGVCKVSLVGVGRCTLRLFTENPKLHVLPMDSCGRAESYANPVLIIDVEGRKELEFSIHNAQ